MIVLEDNAKADEGVACPFYIPDFFLFVSQGLSEIDIQHLDDEMGYSDQSY